MSQRRKQDPDDDDVQELMAPSRLEPPVKIRDKPDDISNTLATNVIDQQPSHVNPKGPVEEAGHDDYTVIGSHRAARANILLTEESEGEDDDDDSMEYPGAINVGGMRSVGEEATIIYSMGSPHGNDEIIDEQPTNNIDESNENLVEAELAPEPPEIVEGTPVEEENNNNNNNNAGKWNTYILLTILFVVTAGVVALILILGFDLSSNKSDESNLDNATGPMPTSTPTQTSKQSPTTVPTTTNVSSIFPTVTPTTTTERPTITQGSPTMIPTTSSPSIHPMTSYPSNGPSSNPTLTPSFRPTTSSPNAIQSPTTSPTSFPTATERPTAIPSEFPPSLPSLSPTISPTTEPTLDTPSVGFLRFLQSFNVGESRQFTDDEQALIEGLYESYTREWVASNDISKVKTTCKVLAQAPTTPIPTPNERTLRGTPPSTIEYTNRRGLQGATASLDLTYEMEYTSIYLHVTTFPLRFQDYINSNLETVAQQMRILRLNVTSLDAAARIIISTPSPTISWAPTTSPTKSSAP